MEYQDILSLITQDIDCQSIINFIISNKKLYNINTIKNLLKNNLYHRTGLILRNATLEDLIILCQGIDKIKIYGFGDFLFVRCIYGNIYKINVDLQRELLETTEDIRQIEPGFDQILFLTKNGQVGYLDIPSEEVTHRTILHKEYIAMPHFFKNIDHATDIAGKDGLIYFLKNGYLYEYDIDYSNLKRNNHPILLSKLNTFSKIFIDPEYDALYLLNNENAVYFMGEDGYQVWGLGEDRIDIPIPLNITDIIDIALGREHGLMLTAAGQVYGFGSNYFGQLGLGKVDKVNYKKLDLDSVKAITVDDLTSYFLMDNGDIYQCGYISEEKNLYYPTIITELENIVQIAASAIGTLCLDKYGEIFIIIGEKMKSLKFNIYQC